MKYEKYYHLEAHSQYLCREDQKSWGKYTQREWCEKMSPKLFAFQLNFEFYFITYNQCLDAGSHLDIKEEILKNFSKKKNINTSIVRGLGVNNSLSDEIKRDVTLGRSFWELCHIYHNNAGKYYAFGHFVKYRDIICNVDQDQYSKNYDEANKFLDHQESIGDNVEVARNQVKTLYLNNYLGPIDDRVVVKTIDELVSRINKCEL